MPLPVLYLLVILLFALVGVIISQASRYEFDYSVMPDFLRRRRAETLQASSGLRLIEPLVSFFAAIVPRLGLESHLARTRRLLVRAGHPEGHTAQTFVGYSMAISLLVYLGVTALYMLMEGAFRPFMGIVPAILFYFVPRWNLATAGTTRRIQIDRQIPYFLDLVSLTMGAGATFLEASRAITGGQARGPLLDEIEIMLHEVNAGTPLDEALANMARRSDSEELQLMVQAVRQGEELGTPLVDVFERQADMNRFRRSQKGEQAAAKMPNRIALPTTFMMLSVMLLLFGPIILKYIRGDLG